jgi:hypothetical protein
MAEPEAFSPAGRRPVAASEVRDLPEPDSPIRPRRSPRLSEKDRFDTSALLPAWTDRFSRERRTVILRA